MLRLQGSAVCTHLSPGQVSFLVVPALVDLDWPPPLPDTEGPGGSVGRKSRAKHLFDNPNFIYKGREGDLSDTIALLKENCRLNKNCCQLGQGSILQWEVPGHAVT